MSNLNELKSRLEALPAEDFTEIYRWMSEIDWRMWDKEIEADSKAGKLDFLMRDARKQSG
jgi:hypothetical protein